MTYLVYTNTIKDVASPITVEADRLTVEDGTMFLMKDTDERRNIEVASFAPGVWIMVLPVTPKGEK